MFITVVGSRHLTTSRQHRECREEFHFPVDRQIPVYLSLMPCTSYPLFMDGPIEYRSFSLSKQVIYRRGERRRWLPRGGDFKGSYLRWLSLEILHNPAAAAHTRWHHVCNRFTEAKGNRLEWTVSTWVRGAGWDNEDLRIISEDFWRAVVLVANIKTRDPDYLKLK